MTPSSSGSKAWDDVLKPRKRDYDLAINLLKRHGMAAVQRASFGGDETKRLAAGAESIARTVAHLRNLRDEAPDE